MNATDRPAGFYRTDAHGAVCVLCEGRDHTHAPECAILTLHAQLRELTGAVGLFVATMRETTEALERLLRGDAGDGTGGM